MSRTLVIGIDGMDFLLVNKFLSQLPNLAQIAEKGSFQKLDSVFPPDTFAAWPSIFTGLNPMQLGIMYIPDVFHEGETPDDLDTSLLRGRTFWDVAGAHCKKVCVIFPSPLLYPPWKVNGIMVTKSWKNELSTFPESKEVDWAKDLSAIRDAMPCEDVDRLRNLSAFYERLKDLVKAKTGLAKRLLKEEPWDLFFLFYEELDQVMHFFWRYCDETDPTHPPENPWKNAIRDFYILFDQVIGEFIAEAGNAKLLIISDHGHGMRPPKTVNLNEYLRRKSLLLTKKKTFLIPNFFIEKLKVNLLNFVSDLGLDFWFVRFFKNFKISETIYTSDSIIDRDRSLAVLSKFSGPKSYPHGGIDVIRKNVSDDTYERLRDDIIQLLMDFKDPSTGQKLVKWACRREQIYDGRFADKYPDVVFELKDGYGVYWSVYTDLIGRSYEHNLVSGGHTRKNAVLLSNVKLHGIRRKSIMDISSLILSLLEIYAPFNEGKSSAFSKRETISKVGT